MKHIAASRRKVLLTGASGLLGSTLVKTLGQLCELYLTSSRELATDARMPFLAFDLEDDDFTPLRDFCQPDAVVHCAAMTSIEECERDPDAAWRINGLSPAKLQRIFPEAYFVHVSTDAVFGLDAVAPDEDFPPAPISEYGKSKLAGERGLLTSAAAAVVLRTTLVGSGGRRTTPSLVDWLMAGFTAGKALLLYEDVFFTPISVWHFAEVIAWCLAHQPVGVLHAGGGERLSKKDFALRLAREAGLGDIPFKATRLAESASGTLRRLDQSLDSGRLQQCMGKPLPNADACVRSIVENHGVDA